MSLLTELGKLIGTIFYKYVAPTVLIRNHAPDLFPI